MRGRRWSTLLGLAGTLITAAIALAMLDWAGLGRALTRLDHASLLTATTFASGSILAGGLRWAYLVALRGCGPDMAACRRALTANVFNLFTPAAVGADVYRFATAEDRSRAAGLLVIERVFGLASYGCWFLIGYMMLRTALVPTPIFTLGAFGFAAIVILPVILLGVMRLTFRISIRQERGFLGYWLARVSGAAHAPLKNFVVATLLSLLASALWFACIVTLARAVGLGVPSEGIVLSAALTEIARLLPVSIQGIGVREATFAWLVSQLGGQPEAAFVACATAYALHFALVAAFGGIAWVGVAVRVADPAPRKPSTVKGAE